ncbi:MAG: hypothetical protein L0Y79_06440 [Chlorobi bacterium]|nr:hypothetical protein [Chlorobiota bacterium]MCI0716078.1 hypothetical protein [Chlorobiota bacterium]
MSIKLPLKIHLFYFLLSSVLVVLYYVKIIESADFNSPSSLNAVASFETAKPYQFRLLMPVLFMAFKLISFIPEKIIYSLYSVFIVYLLLIVYSRFLSRYFEGGMKLWLYSAVILYPMLWNYVILNQSFQFYDFTAIFICTLGMYFIVTENFKAFLITFIIGLINKESIVYLAFSYLLFNYKNILTWKVILNVFILALIFIVFKLVLNFIFESNPGGTVEITVNENIRILSNLTSNRIFMKNLGLNFGALYIFAVLLFVTGRWKKFSDRRLVLLNLAMIPYLIFGFWIVYYTEIRVYTELIPMISTLFLIYVSTFKKFNFNQLKKQG